jgi:hypothetical protein
MQQLDLGIGLCLWFWYFLLGVLSLRERFSLSLLYVGSGTSFRIILSIKGYGTRGWLCAYGWVRIL